MQIRESRTAAGNLVRIETDVTDFMQHQAALRRARDEAEGANRAKSEFLAMMSHELRTPLNAIIGFSEVMRDGLFGPLPPRYQEYLKDINDSGLHLLQIIGDILDMSKLDAGKAVLSESLCDIDLIIKRCQRLLAHRAESGRVLIEAQLPADLPGLWADELKLRQIILNLLSNAVKFTRAGGRVIISARDLGASDADGGLVIEIADNGIGMDTESIPTALTPFRQIDNRLDRKYEGTGLGLPLSKGLVELHGGVLDIKSQVHLGTTVADPPSGDAPAGAGAGRNTCRAGITNARLTQAAGAHPPLGRAPFADRYHSRICSPVQNATPLCRLAYSRNASRYLIRCGTPLNIGVDRDREEFGARRAFHVEPVELIDRAAQQLVGAMMLHDHHRNVVELDRVGQRHQRPVRRADLGRLVVVNPVADILHAGFGEEFRRLIGLREARPEPADRSLAGEFLQQIERLADGRALVLQLVDRALHIAVAHEFPAAARARPRRRADSSRPLWH